MSKGIIITAHGNPDYIKMAYVASLLAKHYLNNIPVALVTDDETLAKSDTYHFDYLIKVSQEQLGHGNRRLRNEKIEPFLNKSRLELFDLSPFGETLLMDADYLIFSDWLNGIWGIKRDIMVTHQIHYLNNQPSDDKYISHNGIKQHWATLFYFRKTTRTRYLFNLMHHIEENYFFYSSIYGISPKTFRNDYALSIALHMIEGFNFTDFSFPVEKLTFTKFDDEIVKIPKQGEIIFVTKSLQNKNMLVKLNNMNVHVLNKESLVINLDRLIEIYE